MIKRLFLTNCFMWLFLFSMTVFANEGVLFATNLHKTAQVADKAGIPIMMFFAAEDCEYCERLEADYLSAMSGSAEYKDQVIIRKVMIDNYDELKNFDGELVNASDFSDNYNIQVTPTLVMVGYQGQRLTKRIIGYNRSGFFGSYLDEAIQRASKALAKN